MKQTINDLLRQQGEPIYFTPLQVWADIIRTVFAAEEHIKNGDAWVQRLREARNLPDDQRLKVCDEYVRALATEIVSKTSDEELEEL